MKNLIITAAVISSAFCTLGADGVAAQTAEEIETGNRLAAVLRAGRSVVSNSQELINDPNVTDKGLSGDVFYEKVIQAYLNANGEQPLHDGLDPLERKLTETQLNAMVTVIDANQELINAEGVAFKGFIPAVFARLVNEQFAGEIGTSAMVKVTAPSELVRNRMARPDTWENSVIEEKFKDSSWAEGQPFFEETEVSGKPAFRMLIPEYYSQSCLSCHGSPAGETDVTGFPKEGGQLGDLAGAISITLFK
ncbi:Tll0287-like domain-containing protein [Ruegeria arenilitoris]|uniref:Tll0287-like domain-containing protein n=1 Tax=Ruegeria arenilitoris TaxID=1173585 RepID=UPI00147FAD89|nr:DUF3365 domain-containing protein [Ruegeria arenilitoris]